MPGGGATDAHHPELGRNVASRDRRKRSPRRDRVARVYGHRRAPQLTVARRREPTGPPTRSRSTWSRTSAAQPSRRGQGSDRLLGGRCTMARSPESIRIIEILDTTVDGLDRGDRLRRRDDDHRRGPEPHLRHHRRRQRRVGRLHQPGNVYLDVSEWGWVHIILGPSCCSVHRGVQRQHPRPPVGAIVASISLIRETAMVPVLRFGLPTTRLSTVPRIGAPITRQRRQGTAVDSRPGPPVRRCTAGRWAPRAGSRVSS